MNSTETGTLITRRRALILAAGAVGGLTTANSFAVKNTLARPGDDRDDGDDKDDNAGTVLPKDVRQDIEGILGAQGKVSDGLFSVSIDRNDISDVMLGNVPIKPAFQINGQFYFQDLGGGRAIMNGDFPLKSAELNSFIDQLVGNNLIFQAEHQHMYDFNPIVWFIHLRATGDPLQIARGIKAALNVTSTPFPQTLPKNPQTPLPAKEMGQILGAKPSVGADGVVMFNVPRAEKIRLGGVIVSPYLNIAAPIAFQPYGGGQNAAAVPDFALVASEINDVMKVMRHQGWDIGCLYNQETDEHPQLYFSHQFKTGNALDLAHEIRNGLNKTNSKFK